MANKLKFTRSVTDKIDVKGILSDDGLSIEYEAEKDDYRIITIAECLAAFRGKDISFTVSVKKDTELDVKVDIDNEENKEN